MKFNINHYVRVKLNDYGKRILRNSNWPIPEEDSEGWSKWQLWNLMNTFGEYTSLGRDVPFDTEIEIPSTQNSDSGV